MRARTGTELRKRLLSPKVFAVVLIGCLAAVLAFSQAAASIGLPIETFRPLGAGFFATRSVQVEMARRIVGQGPPVQPASIAAVGAQGLVYAPLNTRALWLVGKSLDARGRTDGARAAMRQAERVSRRNSAVQLWLGLDNFKSRKVKQGLRNFDLLIRTNSQAADLVTPALARVITEADGRRELTPYFTEENPWLLNLMAAAVQNPRAAPLARLLIDRKQMAPDVAGIRPIYRDLVKKLLAEGSYGLVLQLYPRLPGADVASLKSVNPSTGERLYEGYPPLVWGFSEKDSQGGGFIGLGQDQVGLELFGSPGTVGMAASKMVVPTGKTHFRWRTVERSQNAQSSARWLLTCLRGRSSKAQTKSADLFSDSVPLNRAMSVAIPAGCPLLRIDLQISGGVGRTPTELTVDDLALVNRAGQR